MNTLAWILVYVLASIGLVCTPCLIKFFRKNLRLEKENNDLLTAMIKSEVRFTKKVLELEKVKSELNELKCQF